MDESIKTELSTSVSEDDDICPNCGARNTAVYDWEAYGIVCRECDFLIEEDDPVDPDWERENYGETNVPQGDPPWNGYSWDYTGF